jgi:hypothetical protein
MPMKLGLRIGELRVRRVIGLGVASGGRSRGILDAEEGRRVPAPHAPGAVLARLDQHARQGHVHRHVRDGRANAGQPVLCIDRTDFKKTPIAITDGAFLRGFEKGEFLDVAQPSASMRRITPASEERRISGSVKRGRDREVLFVVQADARAVGRCARSAPARWLAPPG